MSLVAKRVRVPVKRIYARADLTKIRHVKVKSVQYSTMFVLRKDVAKAERLFSTLKGY
jgi:hypothetical protein